MYGRFLKLVADADLLTDLVLNRESARLRVRVLGRLLPAVPLQIRQVRGCHRRALVVRIGDFAAAVGTVTRNNGELFSSPGVTILC